MQYLVLYVYQDDVKFLRIGRVAKVHSDIRQFTIETMAKGITSTAELEKFFNSQVCYVNLSFFIL